nr:hypothetical protein [uncultured Sphingomonas sp.]
MIALLIANPALQRIKARGAFTTATTVTLRRWQDLEGASWWCERHWQESNRPYRRRVHVEDHTATFEFSSTEAAMEFLLTYGSHAKAGT